MCVLSNNLHTERISSNNDKKLPNHINELLISLEKWIHPYQITTEIQEDYIKIIFHEKKSKNLERTRNCISLLISNNPKFYSINLFELYKNEITNPNREKFKELYQIKVEGDYALSSIENDMIKLVNNKNFTHYRKYYPF